mgnify:CR=1 FL=1
MKKRIRMIIIKCANCKENIIKYVKLGKGNIHRCYISRIQKYYVPFNNKELKCPNCEKIIGTNQGNYIKMINHTFTYSGTIN